MELCEPYNILQEFLPNQKIKELRRLFRGRVCYFPQNPTETLEKYQGLDKILTESELGKLCGRLGGSNIYFPIRIIDVKSLHKTIRAEFDGYNTTYLAAKYKYSERQIFNIVGHKLNKKYKPLEGQLSFFDS
ncbi:hypothetical protein FACS1894188_11960 [Clostridia bacterium]|nr:hypothetical protein FACS1894188_11960 [Clostridia bacterium]